MHRELKIDKTINMYHVIDETTGKLQVELYDDDSDSDNMLCEQIDFDEVFDKLIEWNTIPDGNKGFVNDETKDQLNWAVDSFLEDVLVSVERFKRKLSKY